MIFFPEDSTMIARQTEWRMMMIQILFRVRFLLRADDSNKIDWDFVVCFIMFKDGVA